MSTPAPRIYMYTNEGKPHISKHIYNYVMRLILFEDYLAITTYIIFSYNLINFKMLLQDTYQVEIDCSFSKIKQIVIT